MIHSFLLIGQSNAAGRGKLEEASPLDTCGGKLQVLRNGCWLKMYRPVNPDRSFSGTCLAETFAKAYREAHPEVSVGIIPCADGGTTLSQWQPGQLLFDNAVNCAKLAMRTSRLMGVLWHQGESDCSPEQYPLYQQRFQTMMDALRNQLGLPELPVLVGGLGDFLANCTQQEDVKNYTYVNAALRQIAGEYPNCAYVSADGLGGNPDNLHFSAGALEEFGLRYFAAYQQLNVEEQNLPEMEAATRTHNGVLYYRLVNPCDTADSLQKQDPMRGYGLKNIRRCVEQYGGVLDWTKENGFFTVTAHLNLSD